ERTIVGMKAAVERGRWPFAPPLGYLPARTDGKRSLIQDPIRGPLVRKGFEMLASGLHSHEEIIAQLNALGLRTRKGKLLRNQQFSKMIANPIYMGQMRLDRWAMEVTGDFEPLVDEATFAAVQASLSPRWRGRKHRRFHPDFPLRHFVRCGNCGRPLTGSN